MTKFANRDQVTGAVLRILTPDYTEEDLHQANITWWQNFRRNGGFALNPKGAEAFKDAGIEYQEYEIGPAGVMTGMGYQSTLAIKMVVPYYFYINERRMRVKIYDSRVSMMVVLYDTIHEYLDSLPNRDK
jgi:hypothetical protein